MTTVFFKMNDVQEKEMKLFMKEEGYSNKAEFFRFLLKFYKYQKVNEQKLFEDSADKLDETISKLSKTKKFQKKINTSLRKQLKDV